MASRLLITALAAFFLAQAPLQAQQGEGQSSRGARGAQARRL